MWDVDAGEYASKDAGGDAGGDVDAGLALDAVLEDRLKFD